MATPANSSSTSASRPRASRRAVKVPVSRQWCGVPVIERISGDVREVVIGACVRDLATGAPPADDTSAAKHAELLRHTRLQHPGARHELMYATRSVGDLDDA